MARITLANVQAQLDTINTLQSADLEPYSVAYDSGRAKIFQRVGDNGGRRTVWSGTASDCYTFAAGMREGRYTK